MKATRKQANYALVSLICFLLSPATVLAGAEEIPLPRFTLILAVSRDDRWALCDGTNYFLLDLKKRSRVPRKLISRANLQITPDSAAIALEQRRNVGGYFLEGEKAFAIVTKNPAMGLGQAELWDLEKTNFVLHLGNTLQGLAPIVERSQNGGGEVFFTNLFPSKMNGCLLAPDNRTVIVCSGDMANDLRMNYGLTSWDIKTGKCSRWFLGTRGAVFDIAVSRDSTKVLAGGSDNDVRIWDARSGKLLVTLTNGPSIPPAGTHASVFQQVSLSEDGRIAAALYGPEPWHVFAWDARSGQLLVSCNTCYFAY
jgi:WD40 repeat protein